MKLLFDQNLSFKLCTQLADLFPNSNQVRLVGLAEADDRLIWDYAKHNGFVLVTQDADFVDLAMQLGFPPKVIWMRCGNRRTSDIEKSLRAQRADISAFLNDLEASIWMIS